MKQIDEVVQALACAIGFWRPSWILLKKLKNAKKKFTRQIPQGQLPGMTGPPNLFTARGPVTLTAICLHSQLCKNDQKTRMLRN